MVAMVYIEGIAMAYIYFYRGMQRDYSQGSGESVSGGDFGR